MFGKLRDNFNSRVKWLFHHLGFIIEKVPTQNRLHLDLVNSDEAVQKYVLKRFANNIKIGKNHRLYNNLLKTYIPEWESNFTTAKFMGNGIGEFSFNTFRKVCFQESCYFEKVYFNNTLDLSRVEWFHANISCALKDSLNVPRIYKIIKGDLITIVYFEFTELLPLLGFKLDLVSFSISQKLMKISKTKYVEQIAKTAPQYLRDYKTHAFYKGNIATASNSIKKLSDNKMSSEMIEQVVSHLPLVLTHGDIQKGNVFANDYIIDWDSFGFYPLGFDIAYILFQIDFREGEGALTFLDIQRILMENYQATINKHQWIGFELSCLYFFFIFISLHESSSRTVLWQKTFDRIEELYLAAELEIKDKD